MEEATMVSEALIYAGSAVIVLWGAADIVPTRSVVSGFGPISNDNKRIITMEWVAEGLTLLFIGLLVLLVTVLTGMQNQIANVVYRASAGMLLAMAVLSLFTGARTRIVPIKVCPAVKSTVGTLFLLGSLL
jgi:hypothetical protein